MRYIRNRLNFLLFVGIFATLYFAAGHFSLSPTVESVDDEAELISFTADSEVERDGDVHLDWQVRGVETVTIQVRYGSYKQEPYTVIADLPAEGSWTFDLTRNSTADDPDIPYIHNVDFWLLTPGESSSAWLPDYTLLGTAQVKIVCPYEGFFFGDDPYYDFCPLAEAELVDVAYQPFETGFLLQRSDNNTVYVFRTSEGRTLQGPALRFITPTDATEASIPATPSQSLAERDASDDPFGSFLDENGDHGILIGLGNPTEAATIYAAMVQDTYNDTLSSAVSYMALPDGRVIRYLEDIYTSGWLCMLCKAPDLQSETTE